MMIGLMSSLCSYSIRLLIIWLVGSYAPISSLSLMCQHANIYQGALNTTQGTAETHGNDEGFAGGLLYLAIKHSTDK